MSKSRSAFFPFLPTIVPFVSCAISLLSGIVLLLSCHDMDTKGTTPSPGPAGPTIRNSPASTPAPIYYTVVKSLPHDTNAFTEGLLAHDGRLFESTGHTDPYPQSLSLFGEIDPRNARILTKAEIDKDKYFGEGIAFLKGRIYQLTNTTKIGFIYDASSFRKLGEFHYDSDGWGLTTNGSYLIMSDGSSQLTYRDPITFKTIKTLAVSDQNGPVKRLNELELINGSVYANLWLTESILIFTIM
ncbi:MAG: glutaminyl-peptide cyclotransferase [Puia sp.]|nr:glutaminyl-peptide cyclotransferase [Puia sp.]